MSLIQKNTDLFSNWHENEGSDGGRVAEEKVHCWESQKACGAV